MNRVVHFEVGADDPTRAKKFYEAVFGWEIKKWEESESDMDYWLIMTGEKSVPGINGGLSKRQKPMAEGGPNAFTCTVDVEDIEAMSKKVEEAGGKILQPAMEIKKVGTFASCADTEGNMFGLMQADPNAEMM
jgi:predicted enzyme related to lactoylglutathione lyase